MVVFENYEPRVQSVPARRMQIVIMATGAFAIPSIRALCESNLFEIVCLVTGPLRSDKHGNPIITPARQAAAEFRIPIASKEDVNSNEFFEFLYLVRPDLLFVCDFGQILSKRTLSGSIIGGINLHGSLLPKFRGAAPVHWAILTGEHYTGVSVIHMTPQIDAGPVIAQSPPIPISPHETVIELEERLAEYGAELVFNTASKMATNETVRIIEQRHEKVSKAPRLKKEDGYIPWERSSQEIFNHIRAMLPWPRSFTDWHREDGLPLRLIFGKITPLYDSLEELTSSDFSHAAFVAPVLKDAKWDNLAELRAAELKAAELRAESKDVDVQRSSVHFSRPSWWQPGVVIRAEGNDLIIAAGEGAVRVEQIQPAGKKMMPARDFLRGYPLKQGDRFGPCEKKV
jgi:methionyl-tRNA formyltransferase